MNVMEKNTAERLNKYLAMCGVCSRREADKLIEQGRVFVNGNVAAMGTKVQVGDLVEVGGKPVKQRDEKIVLAYYKPVGVTCTERDRHAKQTVVEALDYPVRVTYAGRLDKDSEGLLLMTNDGRLIDQMMRGANRHEKEYVVKVNREVTDLFLHKMSKGVFLEELDQTTRECEVERLGKYSFRIILTQGLNRQIRRMCRAFQFHVVSIRRIRVMNVTLGNLKPGEYRELTEQEKETLYRLCGIEK
ncbi:MAG: pseudouridine synthase [Lachnospiraceae bacterium]|nr:pseudouridine synthase [Lachnospiraceae bacterium]